MACIWDLGLPDQAVSRVDIGVSDIFVVGPAAGVIDIVQNGLRKSLGGACG